MPKLGAPFTPTNAAAQAIATGLPSPTIVFQPSGSNASGTYISEALVQQACTATAGMAGAFPVYVDLSLNSDAYTVAGNLALGASTALIGLVNQSSGVVPVVTTAHTLVPPLEVRDLALRCTISGTAFTAAPKSFRVRGRATVSCASGATLYAVPGAGYLLFIDDQATLGDGTNPCITVGGSGALKVYVAGSLVAGAIPQPSAGGTLTILATSASSVDPSYYAMTGVTVLVADGVVSSAGVSTTGVITMALGIVDYPGDTSGSTSLTFKFPASPIDGQRHCPNDVGGNIVNGSGVKTAFTITIAANGAAFINPDNGATISASGSMTMSRDYWSQEFRYVAGKTLWRPR